MKKRKKKISVSVTEHQKKISENGINGKKKYNKGKMSER